MLLCVDDDVMMTIKRKKRSGGATGKGSGSRVASILHLKMKLHRKDTLLRPVFGNKNMLVPYT
jgi:hypothetical protein